MYTAFGIFVTIVEILGILTAVQAVMSTRTSQGAIAWAVFLVSFPFIGLPAYWIIGQSKFDGYSILRRKQHLAESGITEQTFDILRREGIILEPITQREKNLTFMLEHLAKLPFTRHNKVELLINGEATFKAIFEGIAQAKDYILVQFYILKDDGLGQQLKRALLEKAAQGVRVFVLYDELGSKKLSKAYLGELRDAGVKIFPFNTTKGRGNRFRINFRNHRKIVVVDGRLAYVGGHNVGDEYLGKDPKLSPWRDTHVAMEGPVVECVQTPFLEDWHWATDEMPELNWTPHLAPEGDTLALCVPTGPADEMETGTLWFIQAINAAEERLWIVSPYFVPDEQLLTALQLAALRGVDVRILIPENPDQKLVWLSSFSYLEAAEEAGIKIYRYLPGFLHQKVMLIDHMAAAIGTANLDNRSMRLNFEITMLFLDDNFATEVEAMLEKDFAESRHVSATEYTEASLPFRLAVRIARLMAPLQ